MRMRSNAKHFDCRGDVRHPGEGASGARVAKSVARRQRGRRGWPARGSMSVKAPCVTDRNGGRRQTVSTIHIPSGIAPAARRMRLGLCRHPGGGPAEPVRRTFADASREGAAHHRGEALGVSPIHADFAFAAGSALPAAPVPVRARAGLDGSGRGHSRGPLPSERGADFGKRGCR